MPALTAVGPVLVHFIDFAQLNSVRTLPYVQGWDRRYAELGLRVLGVHTARFAFADDEATVRAGLDRLGVTHPVALDTDRALWLDYGCEGWPAVFLWGQGGVLRWAHFGEGEYAATETVIQEQLLELDALRALPPVMEPLRPTDAAGASVVAPTPEVMPAGPERAWTAAEDGAALELDYEAAGAWATLAGTGEILVGLDNGPQKAVSVEGAGLYELTSHNAHEAHSLQLDLSPGLGLWSISFEPAATG